MSDVNLAVNAGHLDLSGVDAEPYLTVSRPRRGHPWGLDSLPLLPGCWPLPLETYDRRPELTATEATALRALVANRYDQHGGLRPVSSRPLSSPAAIESLDRLVVPLHAVLAGGSR
jgi:hypothetical protein